MAIIYISRNTGWSKINLNLFLAASWGLRKSIFQKTFILFDGGGSNLNFEL